MNKNQILLALFLLIFSFMSYADFEYEGKLSVVYPAKTKDESDFNLAYRQKGFDHEFQIGKQTFKVGGQPESYSLAIVLEPNNLVRVLEFSNRQIETFHLDLADYNIRLKKKILSKPVKGDYILSIKNVDYFFQQNLAQITFKFDDEGIKGIEVDGMVASLGLNQAKSSCDESKEDCDDKETNE
jgi:hypothetical protein